MEIIHSHHSYIAKYAQDVAGVQPTVVTASANAAKALSELANNLPNTGGLVSWFTGDNDIGKFGQSLEKFGQSFAGYYNSISGIDTSLLDSVIAELRALVDLADGIASVDTSGLTRFAKDLTTMGNNGIDGFIQAFTDANAKVQKSVTDMLDTVISTMQSQTGTLTSAGTTAGQHVQYDWTEQCHAAAYQRHERKEGTVTEHGQELLYGIDTAVQDGLTE